MVDRLFLFALAGLVTIADITVFIYSVPVLCAAWGANRPFMITLFLLLLVWAQSLTNIWRTARRSMCVEKPAVPQAVRSVSTEQRSDEGVH